jgi:hypothetical protein
VNDDFDTPYRQDYGVLLGAGSGASANLYLGSGVRADLHQETVETFQVSLKTRAIQLRITNRRGRIRLMRTLVESAGLNIKAGIEV